MDKSEFPSGGWPGPRTVIVPRTDQGFGFTLRHFIVYPPEASDDNSQGEDQDHDGGDKRSKRTKLSSLEPMDTIFVKNVKEDSPAHLAGLQTGDRIVCVNDESVKGKSYSQVISLIQSSDSALKLRVVPKDEDILQLAYHSQAEECICGSSGSLDSNGHASAPPPPPIIPRRQSTSFASSDNVFSSEPRQESRLSFTVRDHRSQDYYPDPPWDYGPYPLKTSSSFNSALSSYREPLKSDNTYNREAFFRESDFDYRNPHGYESVNMTSSVTIPAKKYSFGLYFPPPTSDNKSSSMDSLNKSNSRYSKENIRDSGSELRPRRLGYEHRQPSFDNNSDNSQSRDSSRSQERILDSKPPPYSPSSKYTKPGNESTSIIISRSHTTSSLSSPSTVSSSPYRGPTTGRRGSDNVDYKIDPRGVRHYVPVVQANPLEKTSKASSVDNIDSRATRYQTQRSWQTDNKYRDQGGQDSGLRTVVLRIPVVPDRQYSDGGNQSGVRGHGTAFALTRSPESTQIEIKKTPRQIVSHRKQQFELGKNENISPGLKFDRCKTELDKLTTFKKFESVANRAAAFEPKQTSPEPAMPSQESPAQTQPAVKVRKISTERYSPSGHSGDKPERPATLTSYPDSAPIRIYVSPGSSSAPSSPIVEIVPMFPDNQPVTKVTTSVTHEPSSRHVTVTRQLVEDEPVYTQARIVQENIHGNRPVRKTSYLSAVNAPHSRYSQDASDDDDDDDDTVDNLESPSSIMEPLGSNTSLGSSATSLGLLSSYSHLAPVVSSTDGGGYSRGMGGDITTGSSNTTFLGPTMDTVSKDVQLRSKNTGNNTGSPEDEAVKLHRRTSYLMATARDRSNQQPLEQSFSPPASIPEGQMSTPPRNPSIDKLKYFFGEKTPSILEATEGRAEPPESPLPEIVKEGYLTCKTTVTDGKKSSDRSWREQWVVLRGHCLFLFKEKRDTSNQFSFDEEKPISIKSSLVDIKHEYAKRKKHVFQLSTYNGSEYLFQAEDKGTMLLWIQAIKSNNNPDCDVRSSREEGIGNADLIRRKTSQAELTQGSKTSPTATQKSSKKSSTLSLKKAASPSVKRKKTGNEKEPKSRGWKERIMPSFKKHQDSSSSALSELDDECMKTAAFGVPLDQCMPSPHNEYVPLIVELCTRIVEARGLDVVGVYRVPGNSVAVSNMQEELNKGIENVNIDNEKWLDVNVISSLLKAFFRKLPEPLVTNKCYAGFIEANRIPDQEKRMLKLKRRLHTLPEHHFETFKRMAEHLNKVAMNGHINKMNAKNLATMFGPTLIRRSLEDTMSMVADMSDQCQIVESVIIHYEWFFSSWEDDHTVPSEEISETPVVSDTSRVLRDDDEDLDSVINTREIVSSIISAANKKLQSKQNQKSMDSLDFDESFNERDIDLEISRKSSSTTKMSKSQSSISSVPSSRSISEEFLDRKLSSSTMKSIPQAIQDEADPIDFDFLETKKGGKYSSGSTFSRHYSDESLLDRNDELEMSHGMSSNWSHSRDYLDGLKRIEQEARALREREEQRQRDMEQRRLEQQRIEQEYLRTKQEMELEETHSVEDLLNWRPDYRLQEVCGRSDATSEFSSSSGDYRAPAHRHYQSADLGGAHSDGKVVLRKRDSHHDRGHGGKYFVSIGNVRGRSRDRMSARGTQGSLDSLAPRFSRAGSLENILDNHGHIHPPHSHSRGPSQRQRDARRESRHESDKKKHGTLTRGGSVRHGSLDSLIDLYDKQDNRSSWASSDSEDGSDLLTSLTTTFDQKLQILLNPKYKLGGKRAPRQEGSVSASASASGEDTLEDKDSDVEKVLEVVHHKPTQVTLPQHAIAGLPDGQRPFRDPSLHRASKSEAKIGIASRFERGSQVPTTQPSATVLPVTGSPQNRKSTQDHKAFPFKFSPKPAESGGSVALTQPRKLDTKPLGKVEFRPISKSEKTEVNSTLARLSREEKYLSGRDSGKGLGLGKAACRSESPGGDKKRTKRSKRRHTVGGTNDLEHFKALISVTGPKEPEPEQKVSAWEQLQPVIKETTVPQNRSVLSWIQRERIRGSTPDLSSESKK